MTLLLSFLHGMVNAPYYLAEDLGYFDQCGIDIEIVPALEVENPLGVMLGGGADYAVIDSFRAVAGVHQGLPAIPIAEEFARPPNSYVSLAETGIEGPEDLPGHTVGTPAGGDSEWFLRVILDQIGLTPEEQERVRFVPSGFDIRPVLVGRVDLQSQFPTNAFFAALVLEGTPELNIFTAADFGIVTPGNVIVAPQEKVDNDPESVTRFMAAVAAGMEASFDPANAARAVELTQSYIGEEGVQDVLDEEVGLHLYELAWQFRQDPLWDENGPGWNNPEGYDQVQDILIRIEQLAEEDRVSPEDLFTNEILERVFDDNGEVRLDEICS